MTAQQRLDEAIGARDFLRLEVSRLSAEVDRLRAERDEQVRVNGFLVGRGKEQDIIRDRLSDEVAGLREDNVAAQTVVIELTAERNQVEDIVRRLEGERDGLRREAAELQVTYSALVGDLDIDLGKARELLGFAAWMGGKRFPIGVTPCGSCGKLAAECDKFDGLDERYRCLGIRSRAFLASTPTGTRARAAAAAENPKTETPGSGTPPTEEGPT